MIETAEQTAIHGKHATSQLVDNIHAAAKDVSCFAENCKSYSWVRNKRGGRNKLKCVKMRFIANIPYKLRKQEKN